MAVTTFYPLQKLPGQTAEATVVGESFATASMATAIVMGPVGIGSQELMPTTGQIWPRGQGA